MVGIYTITNIKNGRVYVGESFDIESRWKLHASQLRSKTHINYLLQRDYNKYGNECFEYNIVQTSLGNEKSAAVSIQALLIMLEDSYIKKYIDDGIELYNLENSMDLILLHKKALQIQSNIATNVLIDNLVKRKYVFNSALKQFELRERNTLKNAIQMLSTIKSKEKIKRIEDSIYDTITRNNLYDTCFYITNIKYNLNGFKENTISVEELSEDGIKYIKDNFDFIELSKRKNENKNKSEKYKNNLNKEDMNRITQIYDECLLERVFTIDFKYNDFRKILVDNGLITIGKLNETIATSFAKSNNYFVEKSYNEAKNTYTYWITKIGKQYIKNLFMEENNK